MHVMLVGAELEENLAIRYLAATLEQAGHSAELCTFSEQGQQNEVLAATRQSKPALIGMSIAFQSRARQFGTLAQALREDDYQGHITCGGHFPTFAHQELLERYPAFDTAVRHEGEQTIVELCDELSRATSGGLSAIAGLAYRCDDGALAVSPARPLIADLDALPFASRLGRPQKHLGIPTAFIVGSRGCYGHCTFCCINAYVREAGGPRYRLRSPADIAEEMALLRNERAARMFVFHDDDFFTRDHARDLLRARALRDALRERGVNDIALVVKARPDDLDGEVFDVLQDIGLLRVYVGIEAGSSQGLKTLGRSVDISLNRGAMAFLRERQVYACYNMLIFDPDTTLASLRESLDFMSDNADVPMNFCRTEVYVGTPLMKRLQREGRLLGDPFGYDYRIADPAAEQVFQLFARAFRDRNFRCNGLMNSNLGLGYYLQLLRFFYPHAVTASLQETTAELIREVSRDSVGHMEAMVDFAATHQDAPASVIDAFTADLCQRVEHSGRDLERRVAEGSALIAAAARSSVSRKPPLWRSVAAAATAIALSPSACRPLPPPPDPLPIPEVDIPRPDAGTIATGPSTKSTSTSSTTESVMSTTSSTTEIPYIVDPVPPPPDPLPPPGDPPPPPDPLPMPPDPLPPPPPPPPPPDPLPPPPDPLPHPFKPPAPRRGSGSADR